MDFRIVHRLVVVGFEQGIQVGLRNIFNRDLLVALVIRVENQ